MKVPTITFWWKPLGRWRHEYTVQHVNAWSRMVRRFIPGARPIVITDYPAGIVEKMECETYPLWPHMVERNGSDANCFTRLRMFSEWFSTEFMNHFGLPRKFKFIHLDMDCLIRKPLNFLVTCKSNLAFCYGYKAAYNPSITVHSSGSNEKLYDDFDPIKFFKEKTFYRYNRRIIMPKKYALYFDDVEEEVTAEGSDMLWVSRMAGDCPVFGPVDGVWTYADLCYLRAQREKNHQPCFFSPDMEAMEEAKIIFFNGIYKPWMEVFAGSKLQKEWMEHAF